jgi:hypothetical protein
MKPYYEQEANTVRQRKRKYNATLFLMKNGSLKFKRRVDFPMWHPDHISKVANILREFADRLDAIHGSNSLRGADKTLYAQNMIMEMNSTVQRISPKDPRERGAERLEFGGYGLVDTNGFDAVEARDDLQEDPLAPRRR